MACGIQGAMSLDAPNHNSRLTYYIFIGYVLRNRVSIKKKKEFKNLNYFKRELIREYLIFCINAFHNFKCMVGFGFPLYASSPDRSHRKFNHFDSFNHVCFVSFKLFIRILGYLITLRYGLVCLAISFSALD